MKKSLDLAAKMLRRAEDSAFVRRVSWIDFEERLTAAFNKLDAQSASASAAVLGNIYLSCSPLASRQTDRLIFRSNSINQAQIFVGLRRLSVWHSFNQAKPGEVDLASETDATISFSQDITGRVMVMIYPYKSDLIKTNENNFMLLVGADPRDLTDLVIERLLKTFLRYCVATSMVSAWDFNGYVFRLWLALKDRRNRKIQQVVIFRFLEKSLLFALGVLGVWATLFTGSKWPLF